MQTKSIKQQVFEFLNGSSTYHLGLSTLDALRIFKTTELRKIVSDLNNEHFSKPSKFVAIKEKIKGKNPPNLHARYFLRSYIEKELDKTINAEISGNWLDGESDKMINKFYHLEDRNFYKEKASNE